MIIIMNTIFWVYIYNLHISDIDDCLPTSCYNGGKCIDAVNYYSCNCTPGYEGPRCATG